MLNALIQKKQQSIPQMAAFPLENETITAGENPSLRHETK
jgi:hypothetical protein